MKLSLSKVILLLCALHLNLHAQTDPLKSFDTYAEEARKAWDVPGMAIAIVKDDKVVYAKGFGVLETGKTEKVDENTVFAIGSNTKLFTSTAIGMLVQEKKISWDDRISKFLPLLELYDPYVTHEITIRDSMSHRSGLGTWAGDLVAWGSRHNRAELLKRVRYLKPAFPFRSGFGYSNIMFLAAGETIPVVTGKSWDTFVQERILNPLAMSRSNTSTLQLSRMSNVAQPHTTSEGKVVVVPWRNIDNIAPAGSINSSVQDMTRWMRVQLNGGILEDKRLIEESILEEIRAPHTPLKVSKASKEMFPTRHFLSYGLGIGVSDLHGKLILSHTGGVDGMISRVMMIPEEKLGIVILTNHDDHSLDAQVMLHLTNAYLGQPQKDWNAILMEQSKKAKVAQAKQEQDLEKARTPGTKPTLSLDSYAGDFTSDHYGNISVVRQDGLRLKLSEHPGIECKLEHWHYDTFLCKWNDVEFGKSLIQFRIDTKPEVSQVFFKVREDFVDPLEYVFIRVPPEKP